MASKPVVYFYSLKGVKENGDPVKMSGTITASRALDDAGFDTLCSSLIEKIGLATDGFVFRALNRL